MKVNWTALNSIAKMLKGAKTDGEIGLVIEAAQPEATTEQATDAEATIDREQVTVEEAAETEETSDADETESEEETTEAEETEEAEVTSNSEGAEEVVVTEEQAFVVPEGQALISLAELNVLKADAASYVKIKAEFNQLKTWHANAGKPALTNQDAVDVNEKPVKVVDHITQEAIQLKKQMEE